MSLTLRITLSATILGLLVGCTPPPPKIVSSDTSPGIGPFDSRGNYREDWADDPSKWRRPSAPPPPIASTGNNSSSSSSSSSASSSSSSVQLTPTSSSASADGLGLNITLSLQDLNAIKAMVQRCEGLLQQIEQRASQIEVMYKKIEQMVDIVEKKSLQRSKAQEMEIKQELMKIAKKAAKKAAKKNLAIAKAKQKISED